MARLKAFLLAFPVRVMEALLGVLLLVIYFLVALPIGLVWRTLSPDRSWVRAKESRWETPEAGRDPSTLEQAGKQF